MNTNQNRAKLNYDHLNQDRKNSRTGAWRLLAGLALGLGMMGGLASSLWAGPLYWNTVTGSPLTNGAGIWDEGTNSFWSTSPTGGPLTTWVADSDAYFINGGVSTNLGTNLVTVTGLVKVKSITQISNYTETIITNTTTNDIIQLDGPGGITNGLLNGVANGNESLSIYAPVVLNTNIIVNTDQNVLFYGGISDGGNGYGIYKTGIGEANSILRFFSNAGNPTQPYTFSGPITIEEYRVQLTDPLTFNSAPITIGVPNSGGDFPYLLINEQAADLNYFLGGPSDAQAIMSRPSITVNSPVVYAAAAAGNTGIFQIAGVANGDNYVECFPSLTLESGMFTGQLTFNTGNMTVYFTNFTRNPGTFLAFARNQNGGTEMYAFLGRVPISAGQGGGGAGYWNVVMVSNVPPLVGAGGPAGDPSISIWPWADAGDRLATYDSTYGLRPLLLPTDTGYNTEILLISNSMVNGRTNAWIAGSPYYPSGFTLQNNVSINSLCGAGAIYMNGTNTLSIVSGAIGVNAGMTLGASPNDGNVAFGSATGYSYCQYARTLTVNSTITGTGGFIISQDHAGNTSGSVVLNGANTYSGLTRLLANNIGLLTHIGNTLALQNSTLDYNSYGGALVFQSSLTSATFGGLEGGQSLPLTVALTVGGDGDSTTYSGAFSGAGSLTKAGPGALTLTGASTHTGTTLSSGQLNINNGGTSSNSAIGTGTLTLLGGAFDNTTGAAETLAPNNPQIWNGNFTFIGSANLDLGAGQVTLAGNSQVTVNASTLTVDGSIVESGSLTKAGPGALALTGASTYYGNTVISGGTLALTGSAAISATPGITVSNGATLDVSGLGSTFTLGGSQKLYAGGTVNGSVNTSSGSAVYPGTDGGYGTNTFKNNLTLASGATANFDLGTAVNGANDLLVVDGNLTLNGNTLHIKAPSASASLAAADYTLFTVTGTIGGSFAATPAWDVKPVNFNQYTVVTSGSTVKLHYVTTTLPEGVGSAAPSSVNRSGSTLITVTVTPGSFPVTNVTLNASAVGGSSSLPLVLEAGNVYTNTVTVGSSLAAGPVSLTASITDNTGSTTLVPVALTIQAGSPVWNGANSGTDSNWSDNGNWVGGVGPLSGDNVVFAGTTALNPVMNQPYTVSSITFSNNAGSFVLTNANGSVLTLAGGGVTNNSVNGQALNVPIFMSTSQTFNTAAGNLAVGGVISGVAPVLNNVGTGALTLSGANTYEGGTTVTSGTLVVANNGVLGIGPLTLVGGVVSNSAGISRNVVNNVLLAGTANVGVGPGDTFTLSGIISGSGSLTEVGGGSLLLPTPNNCTGSIGVNASTLVYANSTALGTAVLILQNGAIITIATTSPSWVIPNAVNLAGQASVTVGSGFSLTFTGVITNVGGLNVNGAGTVVIGGTGVNTYSGGTLLNSPTVLDVEDPNSPLGTGTLTMAGGYLCDQGPYSVAVTNNIIAQTNTTSWFLAQTAIGTSIFTVGGNLSGSGKVYCTNNNNVFQLMRISGNNSAFTGTFDVTGNLTPTYGVVYFTTASAGSSNANWILENEGSGSVAGQTCAFGNGNFYMGSLSGPGWLINQSNGTTVTLVIGGRNTNATFTGSLITNEVNEPGGGPPFLSSGNFSILKVGTGTEYFTAANPALTNLEVAGGAFDIASTFTTLQAGVPAGGGGLAIPVQVDDGATFGFLDPTVSPPGGLHTSQTLASMVVGTNTGANLYFSNAFAVNANAPLLLSGGTMTVNGTCTVTLDGNGGGLYNTFLAPLIEYGTSLGSGQFVLGPSPALSNNGLVGGVINDPANGGLLLSIPQSGATTPTNITVTSMVSGGVTTLNISWPANYQGWVLESNSVGLAASNAWVEISGSEFVTSESINVNPAQPSVFYRLALP